MEEKTTEKKRPLIPIQYAFILEICISILFRSPLTLILALFEHANPLFDLKKPKQNYNRITQDLFEQLLVKFKNVFCSITIPIVGSFLSIVIQPIEAIVIALNAMVGSFESMGYLSPKCGWIQIFRIGILVYHLYISFKWIWR